MGANRPRDALGRCDHARRLRRHRRGGGAGDPHLYGEDFEPSARVLQIMLPSIFSLAVAGVLSQYLAAIGIPRPLLGVWIGGAALVLALSRTLIPEHGAAGAAAALSIGNTIILVAIAVTAYLYRDAKPRGPRRFDDPESATSI